ncbi:MAG: hypothetical protein SOY06_04850 [Prevotella sp.]|nr:hypothetical protein [Bacteroidales bacterium]MDY4229156.1 hypothetical protein [Prevotella sp.]
MRKRPYVVPIAEKISQEPDLPMLKVSIPEDNDAEAKQHNFYDEETGESTDPWGNVKFN